MVTMSNSIHNLQFKNDSGDELYERGQEENEVNSLKLSKFVEEDFYTPQTISGMKNEDDFKYRMVGNKKKKDKKRKKKNDENYREPRRTNTNKPASAPYTRIVDGEEMLCFTYNTKISETALSSMPKIDLEENEFCIRFDIENVDITKLNEKFKADNAAYPGATLPYEMYTGSRWVYETETNKLAWALVLLNPVLLYGKKGLIQRAVTTYQKWRKLGRNNRMFKNDRAPGDFEKRKHMPVRPSSVTINWVSRGIKKKCKIQVNIDNIKYDKIDDEFKNKYSVFMDDFDENSFGLTKYESKNKDNELAVKIAFLNIENSSFWNAIKALDKTTVLKRAIEAYKNRKDEYVNSDDETEASDLVAKTMKHENSDELENFLVES